MMHSGSVRVLLCAIAASIATPIAASLAASLTSSLTASPQARDAVTSRQTGSASITGTVVTSETTPAPVRRATMTLTGEVSKLRVVAVTDDAGNFTFANLPADRFGLLAEKAAYVSWNYGSKRPGGSGTPIVVKDDERATIRMAMVRGAVITGTVRDSTGVPLPDVSITALRYAVSSRTGERELQSLRIGSAQPMSGYSAEAFPGTAMTDDRGVYRLYGLAAGEYLVSASVRPTVNASPLVSTDIHQVSRADVQRARQLLTAPPGAAATPALAANTTPVDRSRVDYAPVFHPAAASAADAELIKLGPAEERSGVDVLVRLVPTANISGYAARADGSTEAGMQISLTEQGPSATGLIGRVGRVTRTDVDGAFWFQGIRPGRYEVRASSYPEGLHGRTELEVAGRDVTTSIPLAPSMTVSGRVVFDGTTPPASLAVLLMLIDPPLGGGLGGSLADGTFSFLRIPPGRYRFAINGPPPPGWALRSVMHNGVDISDLPFEVRQGENIDGVTVTLTDRRSEITGRFEDAAGAPAPEYVLVVFSADPRFWGPRSRRTQFARPDANGVFVVRDLPAGDYFISALTDLEDGQWHDPAFLTALAAGSPIKVTLADGEKKVQNIRIGR